MRSIRILCFGMGLTLALASSSVLGVAKPESYKATTSVGPDAQTGGWFINLGITGAQGKIMPEAPKVMEVAYVFESTPAYGKLKVGDKIVGANGRAFKEPHKFGYGMDKFGYEGPMMDIGHALEESQGARLGGRLTFAIVRGGAKQTISLQLPTKYGQFAKTYPFNCRKTDIVLKELYAYLVERQRSNGSWAGRPHFNAFASLALLSTGDRKYLPTVKRAMQYMAGATGAKLTYGGLDCWKYGLYGVALSEYYLATGERWVLPELEQINRWLRQAQFRKPYNGKGIGGWGHRPANRPEGNGYGPICMITSQAMAAWGLMAQCGVNVDEEAHQLAHEFIAKGTNKIGYVWYADGGAGNSRYADMGRTGGSAIAHAVSPFGGREHQQFALRNARCIGTNYKTFPDTHGSPMLGMGWTGLGAAVDPAAFRNLMDQSIWLWNLSHCPDGTFYFQPNRDGNSQDYGADPRLVASAVTAMILSVKHKTLRVMGATIYVEGVNPTKLTINTKMPFKFIADGEFGRTHRTLTATRAKLERVKAAADKIGRSAKPIPGPGGIRITVEEELRTVDAMLAHVGKQLAATIEDIQIKDKSEDVYHLKQTLLTARKTWGGVAAFEEVARPIEKTFMAEPRRTAYRVGTGYYTLLARIKTKPGKATLRLMSRFAERNKDSYYGKLAGEAVAEYNQIAN